MNAKPESSAGRALSQVMAPWPLSVRAEFLQYLEAKAKQEGNLAYLREIKAYRLLVESRPT